MFPVRRVHLFLPGDVSVFSVVRTALAAAQGFPYVATVFAALVDEVQFVLSLFDFNNYNGAVAFFAVSIFTVNPHDQFSAAATVNRIFDVSHWT
jgi:hypothetical protein